MIRLALAHRTFFETLLLIGIFCILVLDTFISVGDHSTLPRTAWIISFNSMVGTGVFLLYRRLRNPYRQLTANDINQLLDLSKDAISVMDLRSGRLVYANQATGKVFGLSAEQLLSEGLPDLFPPETVAYFRNAYQQLKRSGAPFTHTIEVEIPRPDGARIWIESALTLSRTPQGTSLLMGVSRDITDRKHAEAQLTERERLFRALFDDNPYALTLVRCGQKSSLEVNRAWEKLFLPPKDIPLDALVDSAWELSRWVDPGQRQEITEQLRVSSHVRGKKITMRRPATGEIIQILFSSELIPIPGQEPIALNIYIDISEQMAMERQLREQENLFRAIFDNIPSGASISLLPDKGFLEVNQTWREMFGHPGGAIEKTWEMGRWVDLAERQALLDDIAQGTLIDNHGVRLRNQATHREFHALMSSRCIPFRDGEAVVSIITDIETHHQMTEQLRLTEVERAQEAEQREQLKTQFLRAVSHDLRQPLHAAKLFADLLVKDGLAEENHRRCQHILAALKIADSILESLLQSARLGAGAAVARYEHCDVLTAILAPLEAEFAQLAQLQGLNFKIFLPGRRDNLFVDPRMVLAVMRNLLGNALKYTPRGGLLVSYRPRPQEGVALFQVWDTGIGIAQEDQATIFEDFFQVGNSQRDIAQGLGLGLPTARKVAHILKGSLECRSRPGRGSVFTLRLPLTPEGMEQFVVDAAEPPVAHDQDLIA